jgi:ferredoxin
MSFCDDCPDHEACATGWPCWKVKELHPALDEFTATPEPLTFEELVWACDTCGWAVALCPEHAAMARDITAEQEADMRAGDPP